MAGGRPTSYRAEYCDTVVALGLEGKSVVQMACEIGVHKDTLYQWARDHEEFSASFAYAKQCAQCWWENRGQEGIEKPGFNANLWSRSMAARFPEDYTERRKNEVTGKDGAPLTVNVVRFSE